MFGVVMANAAAFAQNHDYSRLDTVLRVLGSLLLEARSWPMFALMFGFGIATVLTSLGRRGYDRRTAMRTVRRRAWWLWVLGAVQCTFWFGFDVLTQYAASALLVLLLVHAKVRTWWIVGILASLVVSALAGVGLGVTSFDVGEVSVASASTYWASVADRAPMALVATLMALFTGAVLTPMIFGLAHHRAGSLVEPGRFVRLHRRIGIGGLALGLVGGLPWALISAGVVDSGSAVAGVAFTVHSITGMAQGAAYVSLLALLAARWNEQPRGAAMAVAVVGQRSLTVYVLHGLLLALALEPWAFNLSARSISVVYLVGLVTWAACMGVAWLLHRAGRPGPLDVWLRRMTYRKLAPVPLTPVVPVTPPPSVPAAAR